MTRLNLLVLMALFLGCAPCKAYNLFTKSTDRCGLQYDSAAVLTIKGAIFCRGNKDSIKGEITFYRMHPEKQKTVKIGTEEGKAFSFELQGGYKYFYEVEAEDHIDLSTKKGRIIGTKTLQQDTTKQLKVFMGVLMCHPHDHFVYFSDTPKDTIPNHFERLRQERNDREIIFFDVESKKIDSSQHILVKLVFRALKENPDIILGIHGHMDKKEAARYDKELSRRRAQKVADYFTAHGIDPFRLKVKGYGTQKPVATNETKKGRALNRRVEMKVVEMKDEDKK